MSPTFTGPPDDGDDGDPFRCAECDGEFGRPAYLTDETGTVEVCSPECAERYADTSPR